jgi:hypothetical protein
MKTILYLFIFLSAWSVISCKKDKSAEIPKIAGIEFNINDLRGPEDDLISKLDYPNTLILHSDFTWTINLGGAISQGTYTWKPSPKKEFDNAANQQGEIKFIITQWIDFTTNQILSNKLKSILLSVNNCGFSILDFSYLNFVDNNSNSLLRSNKK